MVGASGRNLTDYQRAVIVLSLKEDLAKLARERQATSTGGANPQLKANLPEAAAQRGETRQAIADMAGVSHDTIAKVERIEREAIPELRKLAQRGDVSIRSGTKPSLLAGDVQIVVYAFCAFFSTMSVNIGVCGY